VRTQLSQDRAAKHNPALANVIEYLRYHMPLWLLQKPSGLGVLSSRCGGCLAPWVALSELAGRGEDPARPLSPSAFDSMDSLSRERRWVRRADRNESC